MQANSKEQLDRALQSIHWIGYILVLLSMTLLIANYVTGSNNIWHAIITALAGVYFGMFDLEIKWSKMLVLLIAGVYMTFIILEYFIMGLPEPINPQLMVYSNSGDFSRIGLLNALSPMIYLVVKMLLTIFLLNILRKL